MQIRRTCKHRFTWNILIRRSLPWDNNLRLTGYSATWNVGIGNNCGSCPADNDNNGDHANDQHGSTPAGDANLCGVGSDQPADEDGMIDDSMDIDDSADGQPREPESANEDFIWQGVIVCLLRQLRFVFLHRIIRTADHAVILCVTCS